MKLRNVFLFVIISGLFLVFSGYHLEAASTEKTVNFGFVKIPAG